MIKADRRGKASGLENLRPYHRMESTHVLKATNCTFQEVDHIFRLAVGIAVYDEFFSCMCAAEFVCALDVFVRHTSSRITTPRIVQNLQKTTHLGFQETQKFERYLGELTSPLDLPTMVSVKNVIRDDVWVCSLHRFCGQSSVY
jgi:hypothetical protein